jgi:adenylosuccinate lyase
MPHKKNPISSENISGMARLLISHIIPMLENCALWHERDISHSSVERMIFPDHFGILAYTSRRMKSVIENLVIDRDRIEMKVKNSEKIYSSFVLHQLIELNPDKTRENIYEIVQKSFFNSKSVDELVFNLKIDLAEHHLNHRTEEWVNFQNLREHYKKQFLKVLKRQ